MCETIHSLEVRECPDEIIEAVHREIETVCNYAHVTRFAALWVLALKNRKLVWVTSSAIILIMSLVFLISPLKNHSDISENYSRQQVEQAYQEVKYTFARINSITRKTQVMIEKEILVNGVVKPLHESIDTVIKPFNQGDIL